MQIAQAKVLPETMCQDTKCSSYCQHGARKCATHVHSKATRVEVAVNPNTMTTRSSIEPVIYPPDWVAGRCNYPTRMGRCIMRIKSHPCRYHGNWEQPSPPPPPPLPSPETRDAKDGDDRISKQSKTRDQLKAE